MTTRRYVAAAFPWRCGRPLVAFDGDSLELVLLAERSLRTAAVTLEEGPSKNTVALFSGVEGNNFDDEQLALIDRKPTNFFSLDYTLCCFPETRSTGPLPYLVTAIEDETELLRGRSCVHRLRSLARLRDGVVDAAAAEWLGDKLRAVVRYFLWCDDMIYSEWTRKVLQASRAPLWWRLSSDADKQMQQICGATGEAAALEQLALLLRVAALQLERTDLQDGPLSYWECCVGPWLAVLLSMPIADHKEGLSEVVLGNKNIAAASLKRFLLVRLWPQLDAAMCRFANKRLPILAPGGFEETPDPTPGVRSARRIRDAQIQVSKAADDTIKEYRRARDSPASTLSPTSIPTAKPRNRLTQIADKMRDAVGWWKEPLWWTQGQPPVKIKNAQKKPAEKSMPPIQAIVPFALVAGTATAVVAMSISRKTK